MEFWLRRVKGVGELAYILNPIQPVFGFSMQISDGYNQDLLIPYLVNNAIWEAVCLASPRSFGTGMPRLRELIYHFKGLQDLG